jgi:hypothetical protein
MTPEELQAESINQGLKLMMDLKSGKSKEIVDEISEHNPSLVACIVAYGDGLMAALGLNKSQENLIFESLMTPLVISLRVDKIRVEREKAASIPEPSVN